MSDLNEQLDACPFCGDLDALLMPNEGPQGVGRSIGHPHTDAHYAHCDNCGADGPVQETEPDARAAWNGRAPAAAPAPTFNDEMHAAFYEYTGTDSSKLPHYDGEQWTDFAAGFVAARRAPAAAPAPVAAIPTWQERCAWVSDAPATLLMVQAMKAEIADLRAALAAVPPAAPIVQPVADELPPDVEFKRLADTTLQATTNGARNEALRSMAALFDKRAAPTASTADDKDAAIQEALLEAIRELMNNAYNYGMPFDHPARIQARLAVDAAIASSAGEVKP